MISGRQRGALENPEAVEITPESRIRQGMPTYVTSPLIDDTQQPGGILLPEKNAGTGNLCVFVLCIDTRFTGKRLSDGSRIIGLTARGDTLVFSTGEGGSVVVFVKLPFFFAAEIGNPVFFAVLKRASPGQNSHGGHSDSAVDVEERINFRQYIFRRFSAPP